MSIIKYNLITNIIIFILFFYLLESDYIIQITKKNIWNFGGLLAVFPMMEAKYPNYNVNINRAISWATDGKGQSGCEVLATQSAAIITTRNPDEPQ